MKKRSITTRFLVYIIITILLSNILLFAVLYAMSYKALERQLLVSNRSLMESNLVLLNRYFEEIDYVADSIIYNPDVVNVLKLSQDTAAGMQLLQNVERVYYHSKEELSLVLYKSNTPGNSYSIYEGSGTTDWGDFRETDWYQKINETGADRVVMTNSLPAVEKDTGARNPVHSLIYRIPDTYHADTVGYLRIDIDMNDLSQYFIPEGYERMEGVTIFDTDNQVIFTDKQRVELPKSSLEGLGDGVETYRTHEDTVIFGRIRNIGWTSAFSVSNSSVLAEVRQIVPIFWGLLAAILMLTFALSGRLFNVVTDNFKRLIAGMEKVKGGNLTTRVEAGNDDEIGELIYEFNDMVKQVDELVVKVEKNQILLNQAEIMALQQQINPHFIFNILETIMGLASADMSREVISVCQSLSAMLRYNTNMQSTTLLENEIGQMKNYIDIVKFRFEDRFEIFYDIDDNCLKGRIVKFTLQPLLENAINHGFCNLSSGGVIRVRIKRRAEFIDISIYDNGGGIEKEKLIRLNQQLQETYENPLAYIEQYKSLGIMNVNLRLRMFFAERYHMEIFSKEERGTCIYITIPYLEVEKAEEVSCTES